MSEKVEVRSSGKKMSVFYGVPWTVLIIAYMVVVHMSGIGMQGVAGYVFVGLCLVVLLAEFFKSADVGPWVFFVDLLGAVAALILATVLMCYLVMHVGRPPTFFDWFGCAVILGDAVLSPFNAFRTALRNIGVGALG